jgi:hypothetical protein
MVFFHSLENEGKYFIIPILDNFFFKYTILDKFFKLFLNIFIFLIKVTQAKALILFFLYIFPENVG